MTSLLNLFCQIDDFCIKAQPQLERQQIPQAGQRRRRRSLQHSEIITILVAFHLSRYPDFKSFYQGHVCQQWKAEFPGLTSYNRFVEFIPSVLVTMRAYLHSLMGTCSGISFIDSTALVVCQNPRIGQHRVFAGVAQRGKTSEGWFFGFKLYLVVNDEGELLNIALTAGNVNDVKPAKDLLGHLFGKVYGDKGYISATLFADLFERGVEILTKLRKKMKPRMMLLMDRLMLRRWALVETVIDQLKNVCQVEHSRHRSASGFQWNLMGALIAYCHLPKKPSLHLRHDTAIPAA